MSEVTIDLSGIQSSVEGMLTQKLVGKTANYRSGYLRLNPKGQHIIADVEFTFGIRYVGVDDYYGAEEVPSFFIKVKIETINGNRPRWITPTMYLDEDNQELELV